MRVSVQHWGSNFERLADEILSKVNEATRRHYFRTHTRHPWQPAVNVYESADRILVCAELPGMEKDQIEVQFADGILQISGVRPKPVTDELPDGVSVLLMEIDSGAFRRRIDVRTPVHAEGVRAFYRRGYLWVTLPRACAADPR